MYYRKYDMSVYFNVVLFLDKYTQFAATLTVKCINSQWYFASSPVDNTISESKFPNFDISLSFLIWTRPLQWSDSNSEVVSEGL